jgi:hypothetical protein
VFAFKKKGSTLLSSLLVILVLASVMLPQAQAFSLKIPSHSKKTTDAKSTNQLPLLLSAFKPVTVTNQVQITNGSSNQAGVKSLLETIEAMTIAANTHQLQGYLKHYAPRYTSGDNLTLDQVKSFIEETWQQYPSIQYGATLLEIRMNGNWATVESLDSTRADGITSPFAPKKNTVKEGALPSVLATTQTASKANPVANRLDITAPGILETQSRTLMFFHKVGESWLVESDRTLYETAMLRFGDVGRIGLEFHAPDQVFAGEGYTAQVEASLPENIISMSTLNREAVVFPHPKPKDVYKMLGGKRSKLERVFEANSANRNEMVSISMGLLRAVPQGQEGLFLDVAGMVTLVKRVNVIPKVTETQAKTIDLTDTLVKTSANGKLDFSKDEESTSPFGGGAAAIPTPMP